MMITFAKPVTKTTKTTKPATVAEYTTEHVNDRFLEMLPTIKQQARRAFSGYDADRRQEAVQGVSVLAFQMTKNLAASGRLHEAYPSAISRFAIGQYREGRTGASNSTNDVTSEMCKRLGRSRVKHYGLATNIADTFQSEATVIDGRYPVDRTVGFKIDFFETWLASQPSKVQGVLRDLGYGYTPGEVAKNHNISQARVCQIRKQYEKSWNEFINPKEDTDFIDELKELAAKESA